MWRNILEYLVKTGKLDENSKGVAEIKTWMVLLHGIHEIRTQTCSEMSRRDRPALISMAHDEINEEY